MLLHDLERSRRMRAFFFPSIELISVTIAQTKPASCRLAVTTVFRSHRGRAFDGVDTAAPGLPPCAVPLGKAKRTSQMFAEQIELENSRKSVGLRVVVISS